MPFSRDMVSKPRGGDVDFQIFAAHSLWNARTIEQLIPGSHKFTILRDPVSAFESYFVYVGYERKYGDINQFALLIEQG
jgi:hypothetical protein